MNARVKEVLRFRFQPGDFLLVRGTGTVSKEITRLTEGSVSHVAIYVGGGRKHAIQAMPHGVELDTVEHILRDNIDRFVVRRIPGLTVDSAEKMKDKAYDMLHVKYDKVQLYTMGLYRIIKRLTGFDWKWLIRDIRGKVICSALASMVGAAGGFKFSTPLSDITPQDIFEEKKLETVLDVSEE